MRRHPTALSCLNPALPPTDRRSWLFRDPYAYLKKEPLASIQYMALQDNGYLNNGGAQC